MLARNIIQKISSVRYVNTLSEKFQQKAVSVTVLGADSQVGQTICFLLKQNPMVSHINLYGDKSVVGISADLKHFDTRSTVTPHFGNDGLPNAIRSADIVLLMPEDSELPPEAEVQDHLKEQGKRVVKLADACSKYAPKSILTVCVYPVSMMLPLAAYVFRRTHWYHPGRLIGSAALAQTRANSLTARFQDLDPVSVHVPLVGGPDVDCVVPLFSRATPVSVNESDARYLVKKFKGLDEYMPITTPTMCKPEKAPLSEAFAVNRMVTTIALGLCGDADAMGCAFVRSNIINTCTHLVSTVRYAPGGIVHNYGLPKLTKLELELFQQVTLELKKREQTAMDYLVCMEAPAGANVMSKRAMRTSSGGK